MINGELLEKTVEKKGYTTQELATATDVNVSTVYRAYCGKVSLKNADKFARFLKLTKKEALAIFFPWYVA
jgi:transcriptional regulator with XRE-family HTH domain